MTPPPARSIRIENVKRAVLSALLASLAVAVAGCGGGAQQASPAESPQAPPPAQTPAPSSVPHWVETEATAAGLRSVLVFTGAEPAPSRPGAALNAELLDGRVPAQTEVATVLTDEDCDPDAQGISHCLNKLRLPDGSVLTVRHPHDMMLVPCLSPGERVEVSAAA